VKENNSSDTEMNLCDCDERK